MLCLAFFARHLCRIVPILLQGPDQQGCEVVSVVLGVLCILGRVEFRVLLCELHGFVADGVPHEKHYNILT